MATITLSLSSKTNKDNGKSEILLRYRNTREIALRAHTRTFILPKFFDNGKITIKNRIITPEVREAQEAKTQIERIITHLTEKGDKKPVNEFQPDWAQDSIDRLLFPENYRNAASNECLFADHIEDFLKYKKFSEQRRTTYRVIFNVVRRYELYNGRDISLDRGTTDTLTDLEHFFKTEHSLFEKKQEKYRTVLKPVRKYRYAWENGPHEKVPQERSDNSIVTYMSAVRAYWRWCLDMGYTKADPFRKYSVGSQKYGTPYYLTTGERDTYCAHPFRKGSDLAKARDIFVFQCYIGCRIGDLLSFTKDNIVTSSNGTAVHYIPSKTKEESQRTVKVYLAPAALEILGRYLRDDSKTIFPRMHIAELNKLIKEGLKTAGITRVVTVVNPVTKQSEQHPICDVGSSHMARRTFIGNLYKKVKDPNLVGKLSGHCEGSKAFARYRDIDDDMIREMTDLL